jgi:hypothetical protein
MSCWCWLLIALTPGACWRPNRAERHVLATWRSRRDRRRRARGMGVGTKDVVVRLKFRDGNGCSTSINLTAALRDHCHPNSDAQRRSPPSPDWPRSAVFKRRSGVVPMVTAYHCARLMLAGHSCTAADRERTLGHRSGEASSAIARQSAPRVC